MGMNVSRPKLVNVNAKMTMLRSILLNAQRDVRFMFVIVSARGKDDYHKVFFKIFYLVIQGKIRFIRETRETRKILMSLSNKLI